MVKNPPAMRKTKVQSLGQEDPLEGEMATHSSIPTWRIPWTKGAWWAIVHVAAKSQTWLPFFQGVGRPRERDWTLVGGVLRTHPCLPQYTKIQCLSRLSSETFPDHASPGKFAPSVSHILFELTIWPISMTGWWCHLSHPVFMSYLSN